MPLAMGHEGLGIANMPASFPNITANVALQGVQSFANISGAFYDNGNTGTGVLGHYGYTNGKILGFTASNSSGVYNRSDSIAYSTRNGVYLIIKY